MPEIVVDLLEAVEVQHDHGVVGGEPAEGTIEHAAVGEAGQQVGRRGLGEPLVPPAELQDMPGIEQEGRQVRSRRARPALPGGAATSSGSPSPNETSNGSTLGSSVWAGRQLAAELADQVLGDAPGVAAAAQPEQGTRRLVHGAGHLVLLGRFGVLAQIVAPIRCPSTGWRAGKEFPPARSAIGQKHITADSCTVRPVRRMRNPCVGNPMLLRSHITAETIGVVPPRHQLEDPGRVTSRQVSSRWKPGAFSTRRKRSRNARARVPALSSAMVTSLLTTKPQWPSWLVTSLPAVIAAHHNWREILTSQTTKEISAVSC